MTVTVDGPQLVGTMAGWVRNFSNCVQRRTQCHYVPNNTEQRPGQSCGNGTNVDGTEPVCLANLGGSLCPAVVFYWFIMYHDNITIAWK